MSKVFVAGIGAVSPAGWNVAALRAALDKGEPLPAQPENQHKETAASATGAKPVRFFGFMAIYF